MTVPARSLATAAGALAVVLALGCGGDAGSSPSGPSSDGGVTAPTYATLLVRTVNWNPGNAMVGNVAALAEFDNGVVFFSDAGAVVMTGGAVTATDTSAHAWRSAASVPAADGTTTPWVVGVDGSGHIWRLRNHTALENVSDRYGLAGMQVRTATALGPMSTGFGFDGGFAIASGGSVTLYMDPAFATTLAGANGRVAGILGADAMAAVRVFDPMASHLVSYPVPGASAVAFDPHGRLVVGSSHGLYAEDAQGTLRLRYPTTGTDTVHGLAVSGTTVWFTVGTELGTLQDDGTVRRTTGANIPAGARLVSSPSGDVWTLSGASVGRHAIDTAGLSAVMAWEQTMQPIFLRVCASCHLPGGVSGYDLSTYAEWHSLRAQIVDRVVVHRTMPPPGGGVMTDADRQAVQMWANANAGM